MASKPTGIVRSTRGCSVLGCPHKEAKNLDIHFYRFPGRRGEEKRKELWIEAVNRIDKDGKLWRPKTNSRVCSAHFVGGKKSDDKNSASYIPSIFPRTVNLARTAEKKQDNRVSIRTEIFFPEFKQNPRVNVETELTNEQSVDRGSGPDFFVNIDFADITTETTMRQLAGISHEFFLVLLNFITPGSIGQSKYLMSLRKEKRLLLFLMKMRLGITFLALGLLFRVSSHTASKIFYQVLESLATNTKTWIFWPTRESVETNLPKSFHHYPACRCIVDFMEISTDAPPTVEQKVLMYSNAKGRFTIKFFIAITPDGCICKVSKGYGGRATDSYIMNDSGLLNLVEPENLILTDKRFLQIKTELSKRNAALVVPPSAFNPRFAGSDIDKTGEKASIGVHVERAIRRIKSFRILDHFNAKLLPYVEEIMHMCCIIANSKV